MLYWRIGKVISNKMDSEGWGAKTVVRLADDLGKALPGVAGFSARNLRYMRKFSTVYPTDNFAAAAAKIPWGHIMVILDKTDNAEIFKPPFPSLNLILQNNALKIPIILSF